MKRKIFKTVIGILIACILLSEGIIVGINYNNWFGNKATVMDIKKPDIDQNATDWTGNLPQNSKGLGASGIAIPGYKSIPMKSDQKEQQVNFLNPKQNHCYFVLTLSLPDGTVIYRSKMIPPGKGIYKINLNRNVKKGIYSNCILKYDCYKIDTKLSKLNGANVKVKVIFE